MGKGSDKAEATSKKPTSLATKPKFGKGRVAPKNLLKIAMDKMANQDQDSRQ